MKYKEVKKELLRLKDQKKLIPINIGIGERVIDPELFLHSHISTVDQFNKIRKEGGKFNKNTVKPYVLRLKKYLNELQREVL